MGPIGKTIHHFGPGFILVIYLTVFQSLTSESRQLSLIFPLIVALTVKATEQLHWNRLMYWFLIALSLLYSKVWLTVNYPEPLPYDPSVFLIFPARDFS